jgi:hypothetical protein
MLSMNMLVAACSMIGQQGKVLTAGMCGDVVLQVPACGYILAFALAPVRPVHRTGPGPRTPDSAAPPVRPAGLTPEAEHPAGQRGHRAGGFSLS